ncbi:MAG TPA: S8 family serine peptidase [Solirubrobacterales bacterium]|nr:S8 family serine peptidase [Solirubrobacterales bacterium]
MLAAAVSLTLAAPTVAAAAVAEHDGTGKLSPPLAELAAPAAAESPPAAQAERLGIPADGPGSLVREGDRVLVTARFERGVVSALPRLQETGAEVVSASRRTQTVTLSADPTLLPAIASVPGLRSAWPVREPLVLESTGSCEGGAAISEGLTQLRVDEARQAFALRGSGLTVGVLSDSYDTARLGSDPAVTAAQDDVLSGDLPGPAGSCVGQQLPVNVLDEGPKGEGDEGRAMLQIVHDLAPRAELAFATAFESEESFAQNIERLARPASEGGAGAEVIVDDVVWFEEPFFQDGPVAVAVDRVAAAGVSYFSAAGNNNLFDSGGREIASWEAPAFRDSAACPEAIAKKPGFNGAHCMDFDPGGGVDRTFGITVGPKQTLTLDLQWAEPWNGVVTDLDAFLLSAGGQLLAESPTDNVSPTGTQRPVEIVQWENDSSSARTVQLAVNRFSGLSPRLKLILLQNGGGVSATEYPQSSGGDVVGPTVFGHAGAEGAVAVAAVPFDDGAEAESYSSRGPVTHLFGPVEGPLPAASLGSPQVIQKPDLAATDCGATTFFAFLSGGTWRFCGTSAAAPHAAAVAALVRQAEPTLSGQQVRDALTDTAAPVGSETTATVGAGLVDAFAAIDSLPGPIDGGDGPGETGTPLESSTAATTAPLAPAPGSPQPPPAPSPSPPGTQILRHPPKLVRTGAPSVRLVFRFGSDQPQAAFLCSVDRARFRVCPTSFARRYAPGRHLLRVKARGAGGLLDPTPAAFRFRVLAG